MQKGKRMMRRVQMRELLVGFAALSLISGCVSQSQVGEAIHAVNKVFQAEYEGIASTAKWAVDCHAWMFPEAFQQSM
ncbi:MAG: hypothetical protein JJE42_17315 [Burkholderiales bacterium]|nr:hypothetical protein [Burkholderiales bacterium]